LEPLQDSPTGSFPSILPSNLSLARIRLSLLPSVRAMSGIFYALDGKTFLFAILPHRPAPLCLFPCELFFLWAPTFSRRGSEQPLTRSGGESVSYSRSVLSYDPGILSPLGAPFLRFLSDAPNAAVKNPTEAIHMGTDHVLFEFRFPIIPSFPLRFFTFSP